MQNLAGQARLGCTDNIDGRSVFIALERNGRFPLEEIAASFTSDGRPPFGWKQPFDKSG